MLNKIDVFKLQTPDQIQQIYNELNKNLLVNNDKYFHFTESDLTKYLRNPNNSMVYRFNKFKRNWENFNMHKQMLKHFFSHNQVEYPEIFKDNKRIIIKDIILDYKDILNEINILKLKKQQINYVYIQIINKLVKQILTNKVLYEYKIKLCLVDILKNKIEVEYSDLKTDKEYKKEYKLNKFLFKYQKIYPTEYEKIKAFLIISCDWHDIFLMSTFKQWTSCMNLINTYRDHKIKYSNENDVKSGSLVSYLILDLADGKTIDEIMDDNRI